VGAKKAGGPSTGGHQTLTQTHDHRGVGVHVHQLAVLVRGRQRPQPVKQLNRVRHHVALVELLQQRSEGPVDVVLVCC